MAEIAALTETEVTKLRNETKGTSHKIHFNNAGASLPPDTVVNTVVSYLQEEALQGGYETEFKYREELDNAYVLVARLLNAEPEEIAIVENASYGWCAAFYGMDLKKGDVVLTSEMEYVTNVIGLLNLKDEQGIEIIVVPNDEHGNFSLAALEAAITPHVKLIAVTHIPSAAGGMISIVDIGKIARKHNIVYLLDACQSAGQVPLDVQEIGCDMLAVTGRKYLRAPRGTGFLYVHKSVQDRLKLLFMDGFSVQSITETGFKPRDNARRFELYEKNRALTLGMAKAVEYALNIGVDRIWLRIQYLADLMRKQLAQIENITVHDFGAEQCGIVTFSVKGIDSAQVKTKLAEKNINVSVGLAKSTLYYMNKNNLVSIVRASVHYYNTEDEITALCAELTRLLN